jgi:PBSX family phage portal protein
MKEQSARSKSTESGTPVEPLPAAGRDNRQVIKALVIGGDEEPERRASPQDRGKTKAKAQEDYWAKYEDLYIETPIDMEFLATVEEYSTILQQCVEAYEVNIEGFGYMLRPVLSLDQLEANDPKRSAMSKERARVDNFLKGSTGDDTLTAFRRKRRHDLESTGNSFTELVRHPFTKLPDKFVHVPSYQCRLGKLDDEFTEYTQHRQVEVEPGVFKVEKVRDVKRFRRFLQLQYGLASGPDVVWFKEYGDPRVIDCRTGDVVKPEDEAKFPEKYRASEMFHQRIYSSRTPYGLPRYKGCLITLLGDREAEEVNYTTLKNNNIPSMIVAVSNGQVSQETVDRIKSFTKEQIQGSKNLSRFLILEAEGVFEGTDPGNMRLDVKPLAPYQMKDQLFQEYGKGNREKIRQCFRLPPIFIGVSEDYTRATAEASRRLADEQIFRPERDEVDAFFNRVLLEFDMSYHVFKSNGPNITDDEDLLKLLIAAEKAGGMDPRTAREIVDDILGRSSREGWPDGIDPDIPFSKQMAEAVKNQAQPNEVGQQVTALKRSTPEPVDALTALMFFRDQLVSEIQQRQGE